MDTITLHKVNRLEGIIIPPPDKSISHRAIFFSSIANGKSYIHNFLNAADPISTINAFKELGVNIKEEKSIKDRNFLIVEGTGLFSLKKPNKVIDCGNSGTTIRLLTGLLSACPFHSVLTGDESLRGRPMSRVIKPLRRMHASIEDNEYPPVKIWGGGLSPIYYDMPIASAQVKTAIILAAMLTEGTTVIRQPIMSRDHTEQMLKAYGADISVEGLNISVTGATELHAVDITVPGDFSSAAFFICASQIIKGSEIRIINVGLNPTRTGLLNVLTKMGANIEKINENTKSGEQIGSLNCGCPDALKAVTIKEDQIPFLIDEFPIIAVLATQAEGTTTITGASELRVKESDRITAMATELTKMGADVEQLPDGMIIRGKTNLKGARVSSHNDHRIAMALSIAALVAEGDTLIEGKSAVDISFPEFYPTLERLIK
jgi:3-phosphoshikimate 1-carboxyvinyltransferase